MKRRRTHNDLYISVIAHSDIFPLLPILIAILLIAMGVFGEIQSNLDTINTVLVIVVSVVFTWIGIYNLTQNISTTRKVLSTICCIGAGILSSMVLCYLIKVIAAIEFGILGLIEFIFVLVIGGGLALVAIIWSIIGCLWFSD